MIFFFGQPLCTARHLFSWILYMFSICRVVLTMEESRGKTGFWEGHILMQYAWQYTLLCVCIRNDGTLLQIVPYIGTQKEIIHWISHMTTSKLTTVFKFEKDIVLSDNIFLYVSIQYFFEFVNTYETYKTCWTNRLYIFFLIQKSCLYGPFLTFFEWGQIGSVCKYKHYIVSSREEKYGFAAHWYISWYDHLDPEKKKMESRLIQGWNGF